MLLKALLCEEADGRKKVFKNVYKAVSRTFFYNLNMDNCRFVFVGDSNLIIRKERF